LNLDIKFVDQDGGPTPMTADAVPLPTRLNISELARAHNVSRRTIQRRLAKGWAPPAQRPTPPPTEVRTIAHAAHHSAHHGRTVAMAALVAALSLAACSAGFSIVGLTAIFAGAFWPVVAMGAALEFGKLSAVAWLGQRQGGRALRCALAAIVVVLMALNTIGIYGFLARAHIAHAVAGEAKVDGDAAAVDGRISVQSAVVADLDRRIGALDAMVAAATARGRIKSAMALVAEQTNSRADLVTQRDAAATALAGLQAQRAAVNAERKQVEADFGPVRYLAVLVGAGDEATMRYFILAVALLLDPAAVLLLLAAARPRAS
jgi:hypothetical protein